ncbi:MAG: GDP-L-fucose synthase [Parvularculaceae bacterium]|nr:GDP-L-fucose synthase [Parvularculaceae bacterium]
MAGKRVYVAGHRGMVGSAIVRRLQSENPAEIITATSSEVDLRDQRATRELFGDTKPEAVFMPAAKVGGIVANDSYPADFLYDNLIMASNVIHAAHEAGAEKLLFLGSSCIFPKLAPQPLVEEALLTGPLEQTNEWYAIAKIAGIKLCDAYRKQHGADFISAMPCNLYGPGDNYHPQNSHVLPALIRKVHDAKANGSSSVEIWGTGTPLREFLHVDDCADGLVFIMKHHSAAGFLNLGSGTDQSIEQLAHTVMEVVGFEGDLTKDLSKPDGTPRKLMNVDRLRELGWQSSIELKSGIQNAYADYLDRYQN